MICSLPVDSICLGMTTQQQPVVNELSLLVPIELNIQGMKKEAVLSKHEKWEIKVAYEGQSFQIYTNYDCVVESEDVVEALFEQTIAWTVYENVNLTNNILVEVQLLRNSWVGE